MSRLDVTTDCTDCETRIRDEAIAELLSPYDVESIEELIENVKRKAMAEAIEEYTEWLRKVHANFDENYAEDIKSDYLDWLKEQ